MSIVVTYPAQITAYIKVFFKFKDLAEKELSRIEEFKEGGRHPVSGKKSYQYRFYSCESGREPEFNPFIKSGGFLQVIRPMYLLSSILAMLEQGNGVHMDNHENLSKTSEVEKSIWGMNFCKNYSGPTILKAQP